MNVLPFWCLLGRHAWEFMGLAQFGRGRLERCRRCRKPRRVVLSIKELEDALVAERRFTCWACCCVVESIDYCPRCGEARGESRKP